MSVWRVSFQSYELVEMDEPEFQEFLQDAVDLIEFANGPADSTWGSVRAKMGHPEPFGLTMVGIGNEQWQTEKIDFFGRYQAFEKAIRAKYPEIKLIGSADRISPPSITTRHGNSIKKKFLQETISAMQWMSITM